jgi:hypothetical protein
MRIAVARRNEMLNALIDNLNTGKFRGYSGTRPTDSDTALAGNTLLFECTLNGTFAASASGGTLTANAITQDSAADATGTLSFIRLFESDGSTPVMDLSVGTSGAEVNFSTLSIVQNAAIPITSFSISLPVGS